MFARTFLGNSLVELGRYDEAFAAIQRGVEVAEQTSQPYSLAMIYDTLGYFYLSTNAFEKARDILEKALGISRQHAVLTMIPAIAAKLGAALCGLRQLKEAGVVLEYAIRPEVYTKGGRYTWFYLFTAMADYHRLCNDHARAVHFARLAYNLTKATSEHSHHCYATLCLAKACRTLHPYRYQLLLDKAARMADQYNLIRILKLVEQADGQEPLPLPIANAGAILQAVDEH